ncbi:MAG: hypothetical protein ABJL18_07015 [Hyphomicrobiales bacterium]
MKPRHTITSPALLALAVFMTSLVMMLDVLSQGQALVADNLATISPVRTDDKTLKNKEISFVNALNKPIATTIQNQQKLATLMPVVRPDGTVYMTDRSQFAWGKIQGPISGTSPIVALRES